MTFKTFVLKAIEKAGIAGGVGAVTALHDQDWSQAGKWGAPIGVVLGLVYTALTRTKGDPNSGSFITPKGDQ